MGLDGTNTTFIGPAADGTAMGDDRYGLVRGAIAAGIVACALLVVVAFVAPAIPFLSATVGTVGGADPGAETPTLPASANTQPYPSPTEAAVPTTPEPSPTIIAPTPSRTVTTATTTREPTTRATVVTPAPIMTRIATAPAATGTPPVVTPPRATPAVDATGSGTGVRPSFTAAPSVASPAPGEARAAVDDDAWDRDETDDSKDEQSDREHDAVKGATRDDMKPDDEEKRVDAPKEKDRDGK